MSRHAFRSTLAAPPAGPFSAGVAAGRLVFVSAQSPSDRRGEDLGSSGSAAEQARRAFDNLAHQLRSIGLGLEAVAALRVYLVDPADAPAVDEVCEERFAEPRPARTVVGVAWLPQGAHLQVEAVAVRY